MTLALICVNQLNPCLIQLLKSLELGIVPRLKKRLQKKSTGIRYWFQEELKAKTQQSTERLKKLMKDLNGTSARIVSAVYAQYGKKAEKLEEFGLKPWQSGGRKGPGPTSTGQ